MSVPDSPSCVRCKGPLVMGHAYELGGDRWHTHCFSCYKCEKPLSCDSNFLVLGTGALICFACSDSCKSCGKKIDDLAIILASSNEAYCSDCFKCCKCGDKIEDLRYAKTKRGLFCIACHERLLQKRKHYEERKRRLKKQLPLIPDCSSSGSDITTQQLQQQPLIPERSRQRPLSPLKSANSRFSTLSREETPITVSSNENRRPLSTASSSLAVPLDFSAATSTVGEPAITAEKHEASEVSNVSTVRSNSESVVAQFLLDGDYMSTADEEQTKTPPANHKSQLSIDDILQVTLENDDNRSENSANNNHDLLGLPRESRKFLLNRTPLRNSRDESLSKSPTAYRQGLVLDGEEIMNVLNSPVQVKPEGEAAAPGLGILTPTKSKRLSRDDETLGVSYDSMPVQSNASGSAGTNSSRSPPIFGHHRRSSSGNAKKLGRSLSLRSKSIMMNLRPKSKESKGKTPPKAQDLDTHSGWGVAASQPTEPSASQPHISSRHQSDSTIYTHAPRKSNEVSSHKHSASGSSAISVYRTPPLETEPSFVKSIDGALHARDVSIGGTQINEEDEESDVTPTTNDFLKKEILQMELSLRRLKTEVNQLQANKAQLTRDIDSLKATKESLRDEIQSLNEERASQKPSTTESIESFEPEGYDDWPERQAATASVATAAKPKFWKLFSGNKPNSGFVNGQNRFEISPPVLQNPNEFEDIKLLPVQADKKQTSATPPEVKDGSALYGSTLQARCIFEQSSIPMIIETCIRHIESKEEYLNSDGLYRKSGSQVLIEQTESVFAQWAPRDPIPDKLKALLRQDIHAVTSILKRYLRKLPNPVFTFKIYEPLMKMVRDENLLKTLPIKGDQGTDTTLYRNTLIKLQEILKQLPEQHYTLLRRLVRHINVVAQHSGLNLMTLHNLCLVFAPGLIRDYSGEKDISDMRERNYVVAFVISRHSDIFG